MSKNQSEKTLIRLRKDDNLTITYYVINIVTKFIDLLKTQSSYWPSKHGCRYLVCDDIMICYGNVVKNVYFDNGGTVNQRFYYICRPIQ